MAAYGSKTMQAEDRAMAGDTHKGDELDTWLVQRGKVDSDLYERYGKRLEADHHGKYVAIGPSGETIVGDGALAVVQDAVVRFGPGNFAYRRIGYPFVTRWLSGATRRL